MNVMGPQSDIKDTVPLLKPNDARAEVSIGPHVFQDMLDIIAMQENNPKMYHRYQYVPEEKSLF